MPYGTNRRSRVNFRRPICSREQLGKCIFAYQVVISTEVVLITLGWVGRVTAMCTGATWSRGPRRGRARTRA